jgi:hypothetical protein
MLSAWSGVRKVARALPGRGGSRFLAAASAACLAACRAAQGAEPRARLRVPDAAGAAAAGGRVEVRAGGGVLRRAAGGCERRSGAGGGTERRAGGAMERRFAVLLAILNPSALLRGAPRAAHVLLA